MDSDGLQSALSKPSIHPRRSLSHCNDETEQNAQLSGIEAADISTTIVQEPQDTGSATDSKHDVAITAREGDFITSIAAASNTNTLLLPGPVSRDGTITIRADQGPQAPYSQNRNSYPAATPSQLNASTPSLHTVGKYGTRNLTLEEEVMSLRVRSLYDSMAKSCNTPSTDLSFPPVTDQPRDDHRLSTISKVSRKFSQTNTTDSMLQPSNDASESSSIKGKLPKDNIIARTEFEFAGGAEDWEDVDADDIDRYGFIMPRVSANTPRRIMATIDEPSDASHLSQSDGPGKRRRRNFDPTRNLRVLVSSFHNKRPPEMLTSPIAGSNEKMRVKEIKRSAKWQNMATIRTELGIGNPPGNGGGMNFNFEMKDDKLIARTWKGIPDCWRAAAWFSFLDTSARARAGSPSIETLTAYYHKLLVLNSPDDVQIDLDVPRTISSHIMFRRRYKGGQRLLFRVLHAISLYFPDIGYVQGMASLAATLLCYYDEDSAFVMLVRMFELRGLHRLYGVGFGGLMEALNELDNDWLRHSHTAVKNHLDALGISSLAFGTRWYLTLFNYSIPFAAQLRVWDVFMLLGDSEPNQPGFDQLREPESFGGVLDVLHAASTALIDGMETVVLASDFEGSMKCLTNWIAVKDEEVLMRSVREQWKRRKRRKLVDKLPALGLVTGIHTLHRPSTAKTATSRV